MEELAAERLILRPFRQTDLDDLCAFLAQPEDDEFAGKPVWKDTFICALIESDLS